MPACRSFVAEVGSHNIGTDIFSQGLCAGRVSGVWDTAITFGAVPSALGIATPLPFLVRCSAGVRMVKRRASAEPAPVKLSAGEAFARAMRDPVEKARRQAAAKAEREALWAEQRPSAPTRCHRARRRWASRWRRSHRGSCASGATAAARCACSTKRMRPRPNGACRCAIFWPADAMTAAAARRSCSPAPRVRTAGRSGGSCCGADSGFAHRVSRTARRLDHLAGLSAYPCENQLNKEANGRQKQASI